MIILTVPIVFPVVTRLGFDPVWFGVIIVMTVFVIKSVAQDIAFPIIALWLPGLL